MLRGKKFKNNESLESENFSWRNSNFSFNFINPTLYDPVVSGSLSFFKRSIFPSFKCSITYTKIFLYIFYFTLKTYSTQIYYDKREFTP